MKCKAINISHIPENTRTTAITRENIFYFSRTIPQPERVVIYEAVISEPYKES